MFLIDFILHIDQHLREFVQSYGGWVYGMLFLIVFCETGLVFMPFLPGDNLLFAAGTLAAIGSLNPWAVGGVLALAATLGDSTNYWIGRKYGKKLFHPDRAFPSIKHLQATEAFFNRHGGKSVFLGRFMPIIRTFTPFVAGMGAMPYERFLMFSLSGTAVWVGTLVPAGYFLGQLPFVQKNLTAIILLIIFVSLLPLIIQGTRHYLAQHKGLPDNPNTM